MKIQTIKTKDGYFVSTPIVNGCGRPLEKLVFNRKKLEPTWKPNWYKLDAIDVEVEQIVPEKKTLIGYNLKPEYVATEAMPQKVNQDFFGEEPYDHPLIGLYLPEYAIEPELYIDFSDYEFEIIGEVDGALVRNTISYPVYGAYPNSDGKNYTITNANTKLGLLDEITTPEILKDEVPCELSAEDSYKIIRAHVKDNIDPKVARISFDYEFCLGVEKRIPLVEKEKFIYDENAWSGFFGGRRKKPKMVTDYRVERKKMVYEVAPKPYQSYPVAKPFRGENAKNLKLNIDTFLEALMEEINRPVRDCPTCKGCGILES